MIQGHTDVVLSLCDLSGIMVEPWAKAGFSCIAVDIEAESHVREFEGGGVIEHVGADIHKWLPPLNHYRIAFAFPPCTHLAVSGARWFQEKGLGALVEGLSLVNRCREILEWSMAPWMLENPVSTISSYWRKPDFSFQPWQYGDLYYKKTCLWTSEDFQMPKPLLETAPDETTTKIWSMAPSPDRARKRSMTPAGFAQAVYDAHQGAERKDVA